MYNISDKLNSTERKDFSPRAQTPLPQQRFSSGVDLWAYLRVVTAVIRIIVLHPFCTVSTIMADFKDNQILQVSKNENNKRHQGRQIPLEIIADYLKEGNSVQARYQK